MTGYINQHVAHKRLLAAVIGLAISDACKGAKSIELLMDARSGLRFLFKHSDLYLSLLDIDPQQFRQRLLDYIHNKTIKKTLPYELTDMDRRAFRINYNKWLQEQALGIYDSVDDFYDEENELENNDA
jgi:hypothetical protein